MATGGYGRVVVGTDGSVTAEAAVRASVELLGSGHLLVVTAFSEALAPIPGDPQLERPEDSRTTAPTHRDEADAVAERGRALAEAAGAGSVEARAVEGSAADVLLAVAEDQGADLIVVGSLGMTGASRFTLGGVANDVTHRAGCDVLVVHTDG